MNTVLCSWRIVIRYLEGEISDTHFDFRVRVRVRVRVRFRVRVRD